MLKNKSSQVYGIIIGTFVALASLLLLENKGTNDVLIWLNWMNNLSQNPLVEGYRLNGADYPPLCSYILYWVGAAAEFFRLEPLYALKLSLLAALFTSSVLFYLWTRDLVLTTIFHCAFLLSSLGLGYLDIYFVPPLLLAFWALQKNRWLVATIFLSLTILIKWQALIFLPFVCIYFLQIESVRQWRSIPLRRIVWQVILPAYTLAVLALVWFGPEVVNAFLRATTGHPYLSANALNINWIITYLLHQFQPTVYGSDLSIITLPPASLLAGVMKKIFLAAYAIVLLKFCFTSKTYNTLLLYSVLGCSTYFMLNIGAHENHLFVAVILAGFLAATQNQYRPLFIIIAAAFNLNLALFYFNSLFGTNTLATVPMTVIFALLNSIIFLIFYYTVMRTEFKQTMTKLWR